MSLGSSAQPAQPSILLPPALSAAATALWCAAAPRASVCLPPAPSGKGKDVPSPPLHFPLEWTLSRPLRSPCWPIKGIVISLFCTASHCTTPLRPSLLLASCPRKDSPPPLHHRRRPVSATISLVAAHGENRRDLPPIPTSSR
jgi:hypothetical protein